MKHIQVAAGCKTRIIQRRFSSLATTYTFDAVPLIQGGDLVGIVEVQGSAWIFPKDPKSIPLQSHNRVTAGIWDTFFSVYVIPEADVVISLPSRSIGGLMWIIGLVGIASVVIVAIALFLLG